MKPAITLQLDPLDLAQYRESLHDLEHTWGRMWAEHSGQARFLSHVHPVGYTRLRQALRREALILQAQDDAPWAWSWPWLLNQELMYERLEQKVPPLTVTHYATFWTDEQPDIVRQNVKTSLQLPAVAFATLPAFVPGRYHERATHLQPADEGVPWLALLAGYEALGTWNPRSWLNLLLGEVPLALCLDVDTLAPDHARSECITTYNRTWSALHGPQRVLIDQDTKGALATLEYVLEQIAAGETVHRVRYLVMAVAATQQDLHANVVKVKNTLAGMVRLDALAGAQAEWAKFFSTTPTADIHQKPLPWGTLSYGVGTKLPVGVRRSLREQGVCFGVSGLGLPVVREPWRDAQGNAHAVYLGTTGGGKTTAMLTTALRWATAPEDACQVVYVDPIGKGKLLTDAAGAGGRFIEVEKDAAVNPLERVTSDLRDQLFAVRRKLSMILGRTEARGGKSYLIPRGFSEHEWPALDLALQALYAEHRTPRLSDFVPYLQHVIDTEGIDEAKPLLRTLTLFLRTSQADRYNRPTSLRWDFEAPVTAFSLRGVKDLRPLFYSLALEAMDDYVRNRPYPRRPFLGMVDELRYLAQVPEVMEYVGNAVRTWRNERAALHVGIQNPGALIDGAGGEGHSILALARYAFLFQSRPVDLKVIGELYADILTPDDLRAVRFAVPDDGECICVIGNTEVEHLFVSLTDSERTAFVGRNHAVVDLDADEQPSAGVVAA